MSELDEEELPPLEQVLKLYDEGWLLNQLYVGALVAALKERDARIAKLHKRLHYWVETMEAFVSDGLISKWDNYDEEIESDRELLIGRPENCRK